MPTFTDRSTGADRCRPARVQTFCTVSRRPAGPLAPPTRRPGRRSRWRAAPAGPTPVGWREKHQPGRLTYSKFQLRWFGVPAPAAGIVRGRAEPVKAVCHRGATAPVELSGERTRKDDLDRT